MNWRAQKHIFKELNGRIQKNHAGEALVKAIKTLAGEIHIEWEDM
ncbi:hypothetical protein [Kiloniella sp. EL199]|nr:hypothetical protein [Kiloniella sp. EL199]